jgi:hypothetical protein
MGGVQTRLEGTTLVVGRTDPDALPTAGRS